MTGVLELWKAVFYVLLPLSSIAEALSAGRNLPVTRCVEDQHQILKAIREGVQLTLIDGVKKSNPKTSAEETVKLTKLIIKQSRELIARSNVMIHARKDPKRS